MKIIVYLLVELIAHVFDSDRATVRSGEWIKIESKK